MLQGDRPGRRHSVAAAASEQPQGGARVEPEPAGVTSSANPPATAPPQPAVAAELGSAFEVHVFSMRIRYTLQNRERSFS